MDVGKPEAIWPPDRISPVKSPSRQRLSVTAGAFVSTNPTDESIVSGLLVRSSKLPARVTLASLCWPSIGPLQDGVKRRTKGLAPWCQTVFNLRRHLRIGRTHNDSVHCQAAELLPQHLLSDVRYRSFQIGKAHHLASE